MAPTQPQTKVLETRCCVVGGGPAGVLLGFLLARAGVDVIVLEKHNDFFRDFRGDTIHPSTLQLMVELGLIDAFLQRPHQELRTLKATLNDQTVTAVDFSQLPTQCPFIALMPQWDFLDFLTQQARHYPTFHLHLETEVTDLLREGDRVVGVRAKTPAGELTVRSRLVVGADGRTSTVRERAGLPVRDFGVPIDVLWMRIPKDPALTDQSLGYLRNGQLMVLIDRHDYFQCGFVIAKGEAERIRQRGIEALRADIVRLAPFVRNEIGALDNWDDIKLLTVKIDRLRQWYLPGLLCIGDAAHAMSPAGGVGINLAVQDAVATANLLAEPLRTDQLTVNDLRRVQQRRERPARLIQTGQVFVHNRLFNPATSGPSPRALRIAVWCLRHLPFLRRITARVIGLGFRPEHIRTPQQGAIL